MNQTQIKLEQLLKNSQKVDFNAQYIEGVVCLSKGSDSDLLKEFDDGKIANLSFSIEVYSDFNIGDIVEYRIALHHTGEQFASYENFIFHQLDLTQNDVLSSEYVIYEEKYNVFKGEKEISHVLKLFSDFIKILSEKFFYRDNQIILFSKTHCEINIYPRSYEKYLDIAKVYKDLKLEESLKKFIGWLLVDNNSNDDELNKALSVHQSERYSIAASEFVDHLITVDKNERIFNLLKNIDMIYQSTLSKYSLYLEDFKYSKFTDKITKYSEEFLNKVNKIISDLQAQILAIPLALPVINFLKNTDNLNTYTFIGIIIYLSMVFYSSCQQAYNLEHIKLQIAQFEKKIKFSLDLRKQWENEIKPIHKKILWHKSFLFLVSFLIGIMMGIAATNVEEFIDLIFNINYRYFFIILLCVLIILFELSKSLELLHKHFNIIKY